MSHLIGSVSRMGKRVTAIEEKVQEANLVQFHIFFTRFEFSYYFLNFCEFKTSRKRFFNCH